MAPAGTGHVESGHAGSCSAGTIRQAETRGGHRPPLLVLNMARELSRRLRVADGILADLVVSLVDDMVAKRHGTAT